jgi:hypothetical protein
MLLGQVMFMSIATGGCMFHYAALKIGMASENGPAVSSIRQNADSMSCLTITFK